MNQLKFENYAMHELNNVQLARDLSLDRNSLVMRNTSIAMQSLSSSLSLALKCLKSLSK